MSAAPIGIGLVGAGSFGRRLGQAVRRSPDLGLIAFTVSQRTRELGIRMVLGAENAAVVALIVKGGLKLAALGVGVGLLIALALMGLLRGLLFGVQPTDPSVILGVMLMTLVTAMVASYIPARRVVRIAPTETLREA